MRGKSPTLFLISLYIISEQISSIKQGRFKEYAKENGFDFIAASVDKDNKAAENCFLKCGYTVSEHDLMTEFCKTL